MFSVGQVLHDPESQFSFLKADQGFLGSFFNNGTSNAVYLTSHTGKGASRPVPKNKNLVIFEQLGGRFNSRVTDFDTRKKVFNEYEPFW